MTDPLLCPRIPLNFCVPTDYSSLGGSVSDAEEKLAILDDYIIRINTATRLKPATREFIRHFDLNQAIDIINSYYAIDSFFRCMTQSFFIPDNTKHFSLPDAYFLLIELKCYIIERQAAILKGCCADNILMIEQYRNHFPFNPPTIQRIEWNLNDQQLTHSNFFVPETILFTDGKECFIVNDAIRYVNYLIKSTQSAREGYADLEICSFFENFRNLLFNNQNDVIQPDIIERACKYVYDISPESQTSFSISKHPCGYASFVELLACTYKNNLSPKR